MSRADADRVAREAGGLTAAQFARIVKIGASAAMLPRAEAKAACAAIGPLTPMQKKFLVRALCARSEEREHARPGYGDLVAWTIVDGCIGPRESLPFDRSDVHYVLVHVRSRVDVLPPTLVVRIVERYVKQHGPLDRDLVAKVKAAAAVLAGNIGSGFTDAAAKLRALI